MLISVWIVWSFWLLACETPGPPITLRYRPTVTLDGRDHCSTLIPRDAPTETEDGRHQATAGGGRGQAGNGWRRQASGNGWRQPCGQLCGQQLAGCILSRAICLGTSAHNCYRRLRPWLVRTLTGHESRKSHHWMICGIWRSLGQEGPSPTISTVTSWLACRLRCTCPSLLQSTCLSKSPWEIGCNRSCYLTKCLRHCIMTTLRLGKHT